MISRLDEIPILKSTSVIIEAKRYNQIRLALLRLKNPLRFEIPNLRGIDFFLNDLAWACVDRTLQDLPVLAWTEFQTKKRSALHEPIQCKLHFYHLHANLIVDTVSRAIEKTLSFHLAELQSDVSFKQIIRPLQDSK